MRLEAMLARQLIAVVGHRERQEMILDVGMLDARARADERAGLEMVAARRAPCRRMQPTQADETAAENPGVAVERDRLLARRAGSNIRDGPAGSRRRRADRARRRCRGLQFRAPALRPTVARAAAS